MSVAVEVNGTDPFSVVHAGQRRHDDPRGVAMIRRQVDAVYAQRQQRLRVEHLICLQDGAALIPDSVVRDFLQRLHPGRERRWHTGRSGQVG
jgi:hypothetical protein